MLRRFNISHSSSLLLCEAATSSFSASSLFTLRQQKSSKNLVDPRFHAPFPKVEWDPGYGKPEPDFDAKTLKKVEQELDGFRLPASYVSLMKNTQNGGMPKKFRFEDKKSGVKVKVDRLFGIAPGEGPHENSIVDDNTIPVCEGDFPGENLVYFASSRKGCHEMFAFCYEECGKKGKDPTVFHVEQFGPKKKVAKNFDAFVKALK